MKSRVIRAILIFVAPIYMFFNRNNPNLNLIVAVIAFFLSIISTAWFVIKEDTLIKQIGNDILYCLILQGPSMGFEVTYLLNEDKYPKYPLVVLFIILLNLLFIILFDCLIQHVDLRNMRNK